MKQTEIVVGRLYKAKVSGHIVTVRVEHKIVKYNPRTKRESMHWSCLNTITGRQIIVKSCQRFREEVTPTSKSKPTTLPPLTPAEITALRDALSRPNVPCCDNPDCPFCHGSGIANSTEE